MEEIQRKEYWFSKDKCPVGLSYPLKRSMLDAALREAGVYSAVYSVRFLARQNSLLLDAIYSPLGSRVHEDVLGRSLLTLWAIQSQRRHLTEEQILMRALPALCQWLQKTQMQGDSWRALPHSIGFTLQPDGNVRALEDQW